MSLLLSVSQEQYVFIHDAILEACLCGETAVPVNEFALTYKEMLKVDSQSNTSQLREEFQVKLQMTLFCSRDASGSHLLFSVEGRKSKNYVFPST